ncbi:hypothetical protein ABT297_24955 [Dactylosporangium sp. NPDC000555]|uniref:hypothetical protein n=1 Tax=Dactylosporangium sp. NPDC000555 TaxID=3154260 RepID=UPI003319CE25
MVFVDGVDGAGKTTMIQRLAQSLPAPTVHVADPLWHYLPAVTAPTDFASWVMSTSAAEVAIAIIDACIHRLADIRRHLELRGPGTVVLVDRGPRTVAASARAHLATGGPAETAVDPESSIRRLRATIGQAAHADDCMAVELRVTSYDAILHRLGDSERTDPRYLRYLRAFLQYFEAETPWPGLRQIVLDATADLATNVGSVQTRL